MAIVVESGAIVAGANSYVSLADANAHHTARGQSAWTGADSAKEAALIKAAELMDASFHWIGTLVSAEQDMRWPRQSVGDGEASISSVGGALLDRDDREIATNEIPRAIIKAQCELALLLLGGSDIGGSAGSTATAGGALKRVKAGSVEVEYQPGSTGAAPAPNSGILIDGAGEKLDRLLFGLYAAPGGARVQLEKA